MTEFENGEQRVELTNDEVQTITDKYQELSRYEITERDFAEFLVEDTRRISEAFMQIYEAYGENDKISAALTMASITEEIVNIGSGKE